MNCFTCIEKGDTSPREAEYLLVDYEHVIPMCKTCLDELLYFEGENNVDYYYISQDLRGAVRRINEILKYHKEMVERYSKRYFAVKALTEECQKANIEILPEVMLGVLEWEQ